MAIGKLLFHFESMDYLHESKASKGFEPPDSGLNLNVLCQAAYLIAFCHKYNKGINE